MKNNKELDSGYSEKETLILDQIINFCGYKCKNVYNCVEEDCVLFRIEKIIISDDQYLGEQK